MTTHLLLDPDGSKRAAMAASLEYGTHPIVGQHLYRRDVPTTPTERYDAQSALQRPAPVFPRCGICGRPRVLFAGVCHSCIAKDEEADQ